MKKINRLSDLTPDPGNANVGTEPGQNMLDESIAQVGAARSIVADRDGVVIAGNKTLQAAADAGLGIRVVQTDGHELVVVQRTDLDLDGEGGEKHRARLAAYFDNRAGEVGLAWDAEQIAADIETGLDLGAMFGEGELADILSILAPEPQADPGAQIDKAAKLREKWGTALGQIWQMGGHRLLCGDCTDSEIIGRLMAGRLADVVFTDPPYGIDYNPRRGKSDKWKDVRLKGDELTGDEFAIVLAGSFRTMVQYTTQAAPFYIWHATSTRQDFLWAMNQAGLTERQYIIWLKPSPVIGHQHYHPQYEPCFYAAKGDNTIPFYGDRSQMTIWSLGTVENKEQAIFLGSGILISDGRGHYLRLQRRKSKTKARRHVRLGPNQRLFIMHEFDAGDCWYMAREPEMLHPTQKPVGLAIKAIQNSTLPGDAVQDLFMGSGTTIVAAEQTGRMAYGSEIEPKYVAVALERLAGMGLEPKLVEQ